MQQIRTQQMRNIDKIQRKYNGEPTQRRCNVIETQRNSDPMQKYQREIRHLTHQSPCLFV